MIQRILVTCLAALSMSACSSSERPTRAEIAIVKRVVAVRGLQVAVRECGDSKAACVLLLHGGRYSSRDWEELGTLALIADSGRRAVAIDLPGFGETPAADVDVNRFLLDLVDALSLTQIALVAPSMSGRFAFPFVGEHPERIAAFIPIAPVGVAEFAARWKSSEVPALIVWGAQDSTIPISDADLLAAAMPRSEKFVIEGAPHACYLAAPKQFHERLLPFLVRTLGVEGR